MNEIRKKIRKIENDVKREREYRRKRVKEGWMGRKKRKKVLPKCQIYA